MSSMNGIYTPCVNREKVPRGREIQESEKMGEREECSKADHALTFQLEGGFLFTCKFVVPELLPKAAELRCCAGNGAFAGAVFVRGRIGREPTPGRCEELEV